VAVPACALRRRSAVLLVALALCAAGCTQLLFPALDTPTSGSPSGIAFQRVPAYVVRVVDGDTINVEIEGEFFRVRYIGIDAPESVRPDHPVEWMGLEASEANQRLVDGRAVLLEKDVSETDEYGRLLRYVFLEDGTFVNAELVRLGYASAVTYPPDVRRQEELLAMERDAREAERGLWGAQPSPAGEAAAPN
jgi:micrococcal nuclease